MKTSFKLYYRIRKKNSNPGTNRIFKKGKKDMEPTQKKKKILTEENFASSSLDVLFIIKFCKFS